MRLVISRLSEPLSGSCALCEVETSWKAGPGLALAENDRPVCIRCGIEHDPELSAVLMLGTDALTAQDQPLLEINGIDMYDAGFLAYWQDELSPLGRALHARWSQRAGLCCCQSKELIAQLDYDDIARENGWGFVPARPHHCPDADQHPSDSSDLLPV